MLFCRIIQLTSLQTNIKDRKVSFYIVDKRLVNLSSWLDNLLIIPSKLIKSFWTFKYAQKTDFALHKASTFHVTTFSPWFNSSSRTCHNRTMLDHLISSIFLLKPQLWPFFFRFAFVTIGLKKDIVWYFAKKIRKKRILKLC